MECEFCKNIFKTSFNLSVHQTNAKYCLKIQNKKVVDTNIFRCEFCNTTRTSKKNIDFHITKCKVNTPFVRDKMNQIIQLKELQSQHGHDMAQKDKQLSDIRTYYDNIIAEKDAYIGEVELEYKLYMINNDERHTQLQDLQKQLEDKSTNNLNKYNDIIIDKDKQIKILKLKYKNSLIKNDKQLHELIIYRDLANRTQDTLSEIAKQPRNTNNTNSTNTSNQTNILMSMTPLDINEDVFGEKINEYFTTDYLVYGQKGVAQFCVDHLLKDDNGKLTYICTDPSRNTFRYRTVSGVLERDVNAKKLTDALSQNLKKHAASEMVKIGYSGDYAKITAYTPGSLCITSLEENNSEFCAGLKSIVTS